MGKGQVNDSAFFHNKREGKKFRKLKRGGLENQDQSRSGRDMPKVKEREVLRVKGRGRDSLGRKVLRAFYNHVGGEILREGGNKGRVKQNEAGKGGKHIKTKVLISATVC